MACVGIDDELADLKKMAGINTAISAVGTATATGALATGIAKAQKDKQIAELEERLKRLREIQTNKGLVQINRQQILAEINMYYNENKDPNKEIPDDIEVLNAKSKKLGNWRTGLVAGSAVTNVAGAIIAGKNQKDNSELETMVKNCLSAVDVLSKQMGQARVNGEDTSEAESIVTACKKYDGVDLTKIGKRGRGAFVSSIVGASTGTIGTITSAAANSDGVRNDNSVDGVKKEKNLNMASNIFAGTTAVASGAATVFNATQIAAIKKIANVAQKCEEVLK